ncbi:kinase-like protein [Schizopora paradoxa]|uniref:Kinase-like protein n=1 Tax=Schizopora paradoxa TaxID=27342 RepID=A0A0H2RXK9_9AGAM|nr:kinase-like protein [Schizopora paradoxa]
MSTDSSYDFDLGSLPDYSAYFIISSASCCQGIGGYGEVYKCTLGMAHLAVKIIRRADGCDKDNYQKRFHNELKIWAPLRHENILKLDGIYKWNGDRLGFVSTWQEYGSIENYVKGRPECDIMQILTGSAKGLSYLHSQRIIHGDLHKGNILISSEGQAKLADFGNSKFTTVQYSRTVEGGNLRRLPKEFTDVTERDDNDNPLVNEPHRSKASDVWSWAITVQETFTGEVPYYDVPQEIVAMLRIRDGILPTFPGPRHDEWLQHEEKLAEICHRCWAGAPGDRPSMNDVCSSLSQKTTAEPDIYDSPVDEEGSPIDDGNETPRVRPVGNTDMDGLTGCIESLNLSSTEDTMRHQEQRIATISHSRETNGRLSTKPQLQVTIPRDILGWRNSVDHETVLGDRRRSCHLQLLNDLLESTPYKCIAELISSMPESPLWIGSIIIDDNVYGHARSTSRQGAIDRAVYNALHRLRTLKNTCPFS